MNQAEYELFANIYSILFACMQTLFFLTVWHIFFRSGKDRRTAVFAVLFLVSNVLLKAGPAVPLWVRYVVLAAIVLGYCGVRYQRHLEKAAFVLLLSYNFHGMNFLVINSISQCVMDAMMDRLDIMNEDYMERLYRCQIISQSLNLFVYALIFLVMIMILKRMVRGPFSMSWQDAVFLSTLNVVGTMLVWMIVDISIVQIDQEFFFLYTQRKEMMWKIPMVALLLCIGEFSAIYICLRYKELQRERERHFVEEQQMKAMQRRLEEAESFYDSIRRVRHEMKNHMVNIKGLVAGEKYSEVEKYIGEMDETMQELDYKFNTGNAVTDVIVNDKYRRAIKAGITFTMKFDYRDTDTISAFDLGIVLNNLLDNAIEACEKTDRKRYISLNLKRKQHFLLIEVENSFDGILLWDEENTIPQTRKCSGLPDILMEHGIGLKNVKDVAEKYFGYMDVKAGRDVFKVTVMLQQKET